MLPLFVREKLKVPEYVAGGVNTDGLETQFIELCHP